MGPSILTKDLCIAVAYYTSGRFLLRVRWRFVTLTSSLAYRHKKIPRRGTQAYAKYARPSCPWSSHQCFAIQLPFDSSYDCASVREPGGLVGRCALHIVN